MSQFIRKAMSANHFAIHLEQSIAIMDIRGCPDDAIAGIGGV